MKVGTTYRQNYLVDERVYMRFIELFEDSNPLHTDDNFAKSKGFKSRVMHGNILNGFLSHFIGECLPQKNVIIHSQTIKYSKPVYLGQMLELHVEVADFFESVQTVEFKFYFKNENSEKVAKGNLSIGII